MFSKPFNYYYSLDGNGHILHDFLTMPFQLLELFRICGGTITDVDNAITIVVLILIAMLGTCATILMYTTFFSKQNIFPSFKKELSSLTFF
jgi:hypothetical protein